MQPMLEQPEAVLDMLLVDSGSELLVLSPSKVSSYRLADGKWTPAGIAGVSWARPLPRDPRGRLENGPAGFRVFVPGTSCNGTLQPEFKITCAPGNETWPLNPRDPALAVRWVTDRNLLESDSVRGAFYSAGAGWFANSEDRIVDRVGRAAGGRGRLGQRAFEHRESVRLQVGWCWFQRRAMLRIATRYRPTKSWTGRPSRPVRPMALPGPVTALWPAETAGAVHAGDSKFEDRKL